MAEEKVTAYAAVESTNPATGATVQVGDAVEVAPTDLNRLVRYGLVSREAPTQQPVHTESVNVEATHDEAPAEEPPAEQEHDTAPAKKTTRAHRRD